MQGRLENWRFLVEDPELLAIGAAVLFTVQSLFHLAYRRDGGVPLSHRPLEQTSWRRAAGVLMWLAFIVGGIALPWTPDPYPAGHAVAGLLFVATSIWFHLPDARHRSGGAGRHDPPGDVASAVVRLVGDGRLGRGRPRQRRALLARLAPGW